MMTPVFKAEDKLTSQPAQPTGQPTHMPSLSLPAQPYHRGQQVLTHFFPTPPAAPSPWYDKGNKTT
jgi:hypothetical protein